MKKRLLIPAMLFPYSWALLLLFEPLWDYDLAVYAYCVLGIVWFLSPFVCNIIFILQSRASEPQELIRAALLVKLVHIPAYVIIFLFGLVASIMILMTFPLILMMIAFDCLLLFISSSISAFALIKNIKNDRQLSIIALICQFFFCADVISLFVMHRISKKKMQSPLTIEEREML